MGTIKHTWHREWKWPQTATTDVIGQVLQRGWQLRNSAAVLLAETALTALSYLLAVFIQVEYENTDWAWGVLATTMPLLLLLRLASYVSFGLPRRPFRYASVPDFIILAKAVLLSSLLFVACTRGGLVRAHLPVSLFILDGTLALLFLSGLHFGSRLYNANKAIHRTAGRRVLIVGGGDAGSKVLHGLTTDSSAPARPVAVVDDDVDKHGTTICGVPVAGGIQDLPRLVREKQVDEVMVCIPSATRSQTRRIFTTCLECGVPVRTLPSLAELMNGHASLQDLRHPRIEDLLQREETPWDPQTVREVVGGQTVLVTGAGGTIGAELSRQIAAVGPKRLLLLDNSENSLFSINFELHERYPNLKTCPLLMDVARQDAVLKLFMDERPQVVLHAAAHKHVGLLELHPHEAIRTNVIGTRNVALAALQCQASRFVNISTDKAVSPASYMGLSKRLTELCIQELAKKNGTRFMNVRFGNVAGSTGSVLQIFADQIQKGGPLPVTDRRATRYFMTVSEAVLLILQAAAQGQGGETFVFDMGEPINIYQLARTVCLFSGRIPEQELPIKIVGLAPGEKINEQLWENWEKPRRTAHKKIFAITDRHPLATGILERVQQLEEFLLRDERHKLLIYLDALLPEFARNRRMRPLPARPAPERPGSIAAKAAS